MTVPLDLTCYDIPEETPAATGPVDEHPQLIIKQTRTGRPIAVCSVDPAPQSILEEGQQYDLPVFTPAEILLMTGAPDDLVAIIIAAKRAWPGARVESYIQRGANDEMVP